MELPMQPKYGFAAQLGDETLSFAPFDRQETAEEIRAGFVDCGVDCGEVMQVHTATTARQILSSLKRGWRPQRRRVVEEPARSGPLSRRVAAELLGVRPELEAPKKEAGLVRLRRWVSDR